MAQRGFSLIELLMVIAIIGVLSTVVVISITSARNKGIDAAAKENLHTVRNQAELYHSAHGTYGAAAAVQGSPLSAAPAHNPSGANFFISDQQANRALAVVIDESNGGYFAIGVGGQTWAAAVPLRAVTGYWCVDANGSGVVVATAALGGGASSALCP